MRYRNFILVLIIGIYFSSCKKTEYEKKEHLENKIIIQTFKQLDIEKKLELVGEGGSVLEGKEFLALYFQYFTPLTIVEARELVIFAAEIFYNNLNNNEKLMELRKKPYPMDMIRISIFIYNIDSSKLYPPDICIVKLKKSKIVYLCREEHFETVYEETYAEALEEIRKKKKYTKS